MFIVDELVELISLGIHAPIIYVGVVHLIKGIVEAGLGVIIVNKLFPTKVLLLNRITVIRLADAFVAQIFMILSGA